jgi:thiazole/oxazole-forming peptide maturase SagD family component
MQVRRQRTPIEPQYGDLLGRRTGLVKTIHTMLQRRGAPEAMLSTPRTCDVGYLVDAHGELDLSLGGKGRTLEGTLMSSIGEAVERYCLCWPDEASMVEATYEEIADRGAVVDYEYLDVYDPFVAERLEPFDRETEILWTQGTNLLTGKETYVPAELVWIDVGRLAQRPSHFLGTSNGCAAGGSMPAAVLNSLYELIERDGFVKTWARQTTPEQVDLTAVPEIAAFAAEHAEAVHRNVHVFEYDSPLDVPTFGAALVNEHDERPKFILGGSSSVDSRGAMRDAIVETIQGWPYVAELAIEYDLDELDPADPTDNFDANVLHYALPDNFEDVAFLLEGEQRAPQSLPDRSDWDVDRALSHCLSELDEQGHTPIAFDLTTRDVRDVGMSVTRVIVPELVTLTPPFTIPKEHPALAGDSLTDKPHPFP